MKHRAALKILLLFIPVFSICQTDHRNNTASFGLQLGYTYRNISEIDLGANFMYKPGWEKKGFIYSLSYDISGVFPSSKARFGNSLNVDLAYWAKKRFMPNFGTSLETFDYSKYNLGLRIGITHLNFIFLNYQYTFPLNYTQMEYIGAHGISLVLKLNWMIPEIGYHTF